MLDRRNGVFIHCGDTWQSGTIRFGGFGQSPRQLTTQVRTFGLGCIYPGVLKCETLEAQPTYIKSRTRSVKDYKRASQLYLNLAYAVCTLPTAAISQPPLDLFAQFAYRDHFDSGYCAVKSTFNTGIMASESAACGILVLSSTLDKARQFVQRMFSAWQSILNDLLALP